MPYQRRALKTELDPTPFWGGLVNPKQGIYEDPAQGYASFYVAGYSKSVEGVPVQPNYTQLWGLLKDQYKMEPMKASREQTPNKKNDYHYIRVTTPPWARVNRTNHILPVTLVAEPTNKYDPNAIQVRIEYTVGKDQHARTDVMTLGYVPAELTRVMTEYSSAITAIYVDKLRTMRNLISARVRIDYSHQQINEIEVVRKAMAERTVLVGEENPFDRL